MPDSDLAEDPKNLPPRALYWFHSNYSFAGQAGIAMREGDWKFCYYFENEEEESRLGIHSAGARL